MFFENITNFLQNSKLPEIDKFSQILFQNLNLGFKITSLIQDMPPRKNIFILLYPDENIQYMQALQMDEKLNTQVTFENKPLEPDQNSKITWKDLRGLSWVFEEEF